MIPVSAGALLLMKVCLELRDWPQLITFDEATIVTEALEISQDVLYPRPIEVSVFAFKNQERCVFRKQSLGSFEYIKLSALNVDFDQRNLTKITTENIVERDGRHLDCFPSD